jgi:hypothetical protein
MRKYLILEAFPWSGGDPAMGLRTNRVDSIFWQPSGRSREKVLGLQRFLAINGTIRGHKPPPNSTQGEN